MVAIVGAARLAPHSAPVAGSASAEGRAAPSTSLADKGLGAGPSVLPEVAGVAASDATGTAPRALSDAMARATLAFSTATRARTPPVPAPKVAALDAGPSTAPSSTAAAPERSGEPAVPPAAARPATDPLELPFK
jgi:hypothetical protein